MIIVHLQQMSINSITMEMDLEIFAIMMMIMMESLTLKIIVQFFQINYQILVMQQEEMEKVLQQINLMVQMELPLMPRGIYI